MWTDKKKKSIIHESELDFIARCVLDYPDLETGGDFFGFWNKDGLPVIQYVTGPGKGTKRTASSFFQEIKYLHECGNYLNGNFALEHIGSWHSHHTLGLDHPSGGDVNTMRNLLEKHNHEKFFISICNIVRRGSVQINGFLFSTIFNKYYEEYDWVVLKGKSPIRLMAEKQTDIFIEPRSRDADFIVKKAKLDEGKLIHSDKVDFPADYYFNTKAGQGFLKKEFEKLQNSKGVSNVEIVQNDDQTISLTFTFNSRNFELHYPLNYAEDNRNEQLLEVDTHRNSNEAFNFLTFAKYIHDFFGWGIIADNINNKNEAKKIPVK